MILGLMGYAQVGKDTIANILIKHYGFERLAFADALRDVLYAINPIVTTWYWGESIGVRRVADVVDQVGWDTAKAQQEVRGLLQRLGTEAGRNVLGEDIWVRTAMAKAQGKVNVVITDVRFPNEAQAIKAAGGILWRIEREGFGPINDHPSETALDALEPDARLWNNGPLSGLAAEVGWLMRDYIPSCLDRQEAD